MGDMTDKVKYLKDAFDSFLKANNAYEAWYERYRLDNLLYQDDVPVERFIESIINSNNVKNMLYYGVQGTCMTTVEGERFVEENRKCDILTNGDICSLDRKWMDTYESLTSEL